jgi:hypothetical protein
MMKITIKELKNLIREAMYQGPNVPVIMQTSPDYEMMHRRVGNRYPGRFNSEVIELDLYAPGLDKAFFTTGVLTVVFNPTSDFKVLVKPKDIRELLTSLGFSRAATNSVDVQFIKYYGDSCSMKVRSKFLQEWLNLFGTETIIDLT